MVDISDIDGKPLEKAFFKFLNFFVDTVKNNNVVVIEFYVNQSPHSEVTYRGFNREKSEKARFEINVKDELIVEAFKRNLDVVYGKAKEEETGFRKHYV